ncbi:MAG TPA: DHHA1 domain-containing protein [Vicinamibacterales bacterium]
MTERLYYTAPYQTDFEAVVERTEPADSGLAVILNRTAFYPTSGGQPYDTGMLSGARVVEVADSDAGDVIHIVEGSLRPGQTVHGTIDWVRRFDHMQQHSGQHVLSAAFERLHGARTISFHLGRDSSTIDLDRDLPAGLIASAEDESNRVVWRNDPVAIRFVSGEEAAGLPLRKPPTRDGTLRLIEIGEFDLSACGGTHVSRTGAIGLIAVRAWERFKGGTRVEFVCGGRALALSRTLRDQVDAAGRLLSTSGADLADAIGRLQAESKEQRRTLKSFQEQLAGAKAAELSASAVEAAGGRLVVEALDGWDAQGLKLVAQAIADRPGHAAVVLSRTRPALIVVTRAKDFSGLDAKALLDALIKRFGGKGGGRPDLAQGGGLDGAVEDLIAAARAAAAV